MIGESRQRIRRKVPDILRLVGLSTKLHNFPDELSGGEQQRVSIARAFVNHPPLLLADEPTGNLDPETSIGIMQLIYRINRTGTTVVVATHDKEMVDKMRRRVIELREGRIIRDELSGLYRPDELSGGEQQRVSIARAFVNHPPLLLADEPTGNLDPETSIGIMQLIYRINRTGTTVVVATHDKEMVDKMRRRVIELREGRIIRDELSGLYRPDESTTEFAVRLRGEMGVGPEGHPN